MKNIVYQHNFQSIQKTRCLQHIYNKVEGTYSLECRLGALVAEKHYKRKRNDISTGFPGDDQDFNATKTSLIPLIEKFNEFIMLQ